MCWYHYDALTGGGKVIITFPVPIRLLTGIYHIALDMARAWQWFVTVSSHMRYIPETSAPRLCALLAVSYVAACFLHYRRSCSGTRSPQTFIALFRVSCQSCGICAIYQTLHCKGTACYTCLVLIVTPLACRLQAAKRYSGISPGVYDRADNCNKGNYYHCQHCEYNNQFN
jgi:hypothetical protein